MNERLTRYPITGTALPARVIDKEGHGARAVTENEGVVCKRDCAEDSGIMTRNVTIAGEGGTV